MAYFEALSRHLPGYCKEKHENSLSRCPGLIQDIPEYSLVGPCDVSLFPLPGTSI